MSRTGGTGPVAIPSAAADDGRRLLSAAAEDLVAWYAEHARDLPWRRTTDPYRILVSEIMLQQTRVEAVRDRYAEFLERFPDLQCLSEATEDEVLAAWSGLGYYRRARNLHRLAQQVVTECGGRLPEHRDELRRLPGIGDYTSAAVASIAFGAPVLTVDGNVARVLSRLLALADDVRRPPVRRRLEGALDGALARHPPGDLNQALMELGARVCLPKSPRCALCPCARLCRAAAAGIQEQLPPSRKQSVREVEEAAAVIEHDGRYLLFRGQRPGVLQRMWEFPTLDSRVRAGRLVREGGDDPLAAELRGHLADLGVGVGGHRRIGTIHHGITDRRIRCHVYRVHLERAAEGVEPTLVTASWFAPADTSSLPLAASARRILALLEAPGCASR